MVDNPTKEDAKPKADRKLVKAYKVMLSIVADWEQSEYSESIEGNYGCQTEVVEHNDLANPTSDNRTQQG